MHEKEISMHENENLSPEIFMDENSMHEIVYSPNYHEHFLGDKIMHGNMIFMHAWNIIFMH